jgi:hypothetical protein
LQLINLVVGDRLLNPLWYFPSLDQPVIDLFVGKVCLLGFLLLDGFQTFVTIFSLVPVSVHLLEHLEFVIVASNNFV